MESENIDISKECGSKTVTEQLNDKPVHGNSMDSEADEQNSDNYISDDRRFKCK